MIVQKEAQISRQALQHNMDFFRDVCGKKKLLACVKAHAYGHGFHEVMGVLSQADGNYVHTWDAALRLRRDWPEIRIVLAGFLGTQTFIGHLAQEQIDWVVFEHAQLQQLTKIPCLAKTIVVWLKVDTGMSRLGFMPEEVPAVMAALNRSPLVRDVVIMTHLACADDEGSAYNDNQKQCFEQVVAPYPNHYYSMGNTAVLLNDRQLLGDWVRVGIGLYGISPFLDQTGASLGLKPVMNFRARIISIRSCKAGAFVGYGATWQASEDTRLAVIAVGYGDGYPRNLPNGTPVLIGQIRASLVGRVSMDTIIVDIGSDHTIKVGDWATLWGEELPVEEIAQWAQTIAYELTTRVGRRVKRCLV